MTSKLKSRLTISVLATASSLAAFATPAHAQSVCAAVGTTFTCLDGTTTTVTGTVTGTGSSLVAIPLGGLDLTSTGALTTTASGTVTTNNTTPALQMNSVGDLSLGAGSNGALNVVNTGAAPTAATLTSTTGSINAALGTVTTNGALGVGANANQNLLLTTGTVNNTAGSGVVVNATNGTATATVNGSLSATSPTADPVYGLLINNGTMSAATVTGAVTVSGPGTVIGVGAIGTTGASATAGGTVNATGVDGVGIGVRTTAGTGTVTCANVITNGVTGVFAVAPAIVINCGNVTTTNAVGVDATATQSINATLGRVSTTGAGSTGISLTNTGSGPITLTTTGVTTTGANSAGILATGSTGLVSLTATGPISTSGATSPGIRASTTTGDIQITSGTVTASGPTSAAIFATSDTGSIAVNSGKLTATGAGLITSTGANTGTGVTGTVITVAGVQSTGNGIVATATGTAPLSITATAPVASTTGIGIVANGTSGSITIREAGASGPLGGVKVAASGAAPVAFTATGGLTTSTGADAVNIATGGTANVTVASGATVNGLNGFDGVETNATGGTTVQVNGTLGATPNLAGYALRALAGPTNITVGSGGQLTGALLLTGANDTLTNNGTYNVYGTSDFGGGADTLTNNGAMTLNNGVVVNGLETLNSPGTLALVGTSTLNGTAITNSGQVLVDQGTATLGGYSSFTNSGRINMQDGAANDTLHLLGNYTATGPSAGLLVDVDGALAASDRLVIDGTVSGVTTVDVALVGPAQYNPTGVVVVQATGTPPNGAFVLAPADAQQGFLNYSLTRVNNNYVLSNSLDASVTDLALIGSVGQELWYQSFDAYHDAIMGRHSGVWDSGNSVGIWGQLYESKDKYGNESGLTTTIGGASVSYANRLKTHRRGGQVGLEYRGEGWVIGVTGGYEWARSEDDPMVARVGAEGHNYGAYALLGMGNGFYAGLIYKRDDYKVRFANPVRDVAFRNDAHSDGVDGEVGFKGGSAAMTFDLNAGLSWVKSDIDPWNQYGLNFDWDSDRSLRGRLGARVIFPAYWGAFLGAKVFHEFKDQGQLVINSGSTVVGSVAMPDRGTWVRLEGGIGAAGHSGALVTIWGDLGDTKSFGARVGFRF